MALQGTPMILLTRASASGKWIFRGLAVAAAIKLATGLLFLFPSELSARLPIPQNAVLALELGLAAETLTGAAAGGVFSIVRDQR